MVGKFGEIRKNVLKSWIEQTNRIPIIIEGQEYENCIECDFQVNYCDSEAHNSFFCGVRVFGDSLTDLLRYNIIDDLSIEGASNDERIFRYFIPICLLVEKILDDFQKLKVHGFEISDSSNKLKGFINQVFKHTNGGGVFLHRNNHHLQIFFENDSYDSKTLSIDTYKEFHGGHGGYSKIGVPSLDFIINTLINDCYHSLDKQLSGNLDFLNKIREVYES